MQEITMDKALKLKGWNQTMMAAELNCSVSLISKLKNGKERITNSFQEKFQMIFNGYVLVNGVDSWKEKYIDKCNEIKLLNEKYELLMAEFKNQYEMIKKIKNIISTN